MTGKRYKNNEWMVSPDAFSGKVSFEAAQLCVSQDIRDALLEVRDVLKLRLNCHETISIPKVLRQIRANTAKRKRRKV